LIDRNQVAELALSGLKEYRLEESKYGAQDNLLVAFDSAAPLSPLSALAGQPI